MVNKRRAYILELIYSLQHRTYSYICNHQIRYGLTPSIKQLKQAFSQESIFDFNECLTELARHELVIIDEDADKPIFLHDIIDNPYSTIAVVGKIAAGNPIEMLDERRILDLAREILGPNRFALEVKGNSMSGDNICDGDFIICEKCVTATDEEQIYVVLINGQKVTLKRIKYNPSNHTITLIPSNPTAKCMVYPADQIEIQGVYRGLLRLPA